LFFFLLLTQICFGQWVQVGLSGETIKDIAVKDATIFAVTSDSCFEGSACYQQCFGKLFRSIDNGLNWTMIVDSSVVDVAISQTGKVFMIRDSAYLINNAFSSLDNGDNWSRMNINEQIADSIYGNLGKYCPLQFTISPGGIIYCNIGCWGSMARYQDLIARSIDDGNTWLTPGLSVWIGRLLDFSNQNTISVGSLIGKAGGTGGHLCLSTDNGNNWSIISELGPFSYALGYFSNGNIMLAERYDGGYSITNISISIDTGNTWIQIASLNVILCGQSFTNGSTEGMLIGTEDLGVFLFSDMGDSLGSRNEGLTNLNIQTLTLDNNGFIYAGTGNGIWRRALTELVTSVDNEPTQPTEFILEQNYPNPFNPSTKISWQSPVGSQQILKVFDVLGNEIATLVDEYKPAGSYEVEFDGSRLASGIYFYKLQAGEYTAVKKMLLIK